MTDAKGVPLGALVTAGQSHESKNFETLMDTIQIARRKRPDAVAGDKGYSYPRIRNWLSTRGNRVRHTDTLKPAMAIYQ